MLRVIDFIRKAATTRFPILILGETGTGKELVARAIHAAGPRCALPFVTVDCGALSPTLIETELFGHVHGAFSGAVSSRTGLLGAAGTGTLILDEVGELPLEQQTRLLRALEQHEYRPVGSSKYLPMHARVIGTTNRDLKREAEAGRFRQDLLFRLDVLSITIPPLRERKSDIALLAAHLLDETTLDDTKRGARMTLSPDALAALKRYDWPGNVRELRNILQKAVLHCSGTHISSEDLTLDSEGSAGLHRMRSPYNILPIEDMKHQAIMDAIEVCRGDKGQAAKLLCIGKTTLYRLLKKARTNEVVSHANGSARFDAQPV